MTIFWMVGAGCRGAVAQTFHQIQITNNADDGFFDANNGTGWHSTPENGSADWVGSWGGITSAWASGYRFPSAGINSGDTIRSAYISLVRSTNDASYATCGAEPCTNTTFTLRVYGVAQDNGDAFSGTAGNTPLDVPYTTAYTDYVNTGPGDVHGSCQGQNNGQNTCTHLIDVTNIVKEITSRPGWTSSSAIRFVVLNANSSAPNFRMGFEDSADNAAQAATLVVNPPLPTIVSSGAWGTSPTGAGNYPTSYPTGPFVYPGASTLLLFLGDYYNYFGNGLSTPPTVADSCGNNWSILAGPADYAAYFYDMRGTVYYVQNPAPCPAGDTITVTPDLNEPIFLHFLAVAGSNTSQAPVASSITNPGSPGLYTTTATTGPVTLTSSGLLISWAFGDSDAMHSFTPQTGFTTDLNSTPNYLTAAYENVSAGTYTNTFAISPSDGWQTVLIGLTPSGGGGGGGGTTPPTITSATTASGTVGAAFSYQITATNSPTSYGATGLPAGLSVNTSTGLISGTPTTTGGWTATVSAANAGGTGTATLTITIASGGAPSIAFVQASAKAASAAANSLSIPFGGNTLPGDLILVAFDFAPTTTPSSITDTQGNTFTQVGTQLLSPGGSASRVYYAKSIKGGADTVTISFSASSAWVEAYLTEYAGVDPANPIDAQAGASGGAGAVSSGAAQTSNAGDAIFGFCPADWACTVGSGFIARSTYNHNLVEDAMAGSPGAYAATATANNGWTMQMVALKPASGITAAAPVITSATTANGTVGSAFSYQIAATNSPTSYGATGLPAGLSVNTSTGVISGSPTASGSSTVTLSATNGTGTGNATLTLTINVAAPAITSATTANGTWGLAFSYQITATNSPTTYNATGLPGGLSVNTATGAISGTPTTSGTSTVTLSAANAGGTGTATLTITIAANPPVVTGGTASAMVGSSFFYQITATNSPITYSASGLPAGLSVNMLSGMISGTPTAAGTSTVTLGATNATGSGTATLILTVKVPAPVITSPTTASATVGTPFSYQITATNSPTSYSASGIPIGLTMTGPNTISGTPVLTGTFTLSLSASNAGGTGTATLTLTVNAAVSHSILFVQATAKATSTKARSLAITFPATTLAGDLILVGFDYTPTASFASITDSQGNTFTQVGNQLVSPGGSDSRVYYAKSIKGGTDTVTITFNASTPMIEGYLTEYSGVDPTNPIDTQAGASGGAGAVSSSTAQTSSTGDVIFAYCAADWGCTAGSGFTARSTLNNNLVEDGAAGSPGLYAATATASNGWTMQMVALKPAP